MNAKKTVVWAIVCLAIIALIIGIFQIIGGAPPAKDIILKTIELHETDDNVAKAKLISEVDEMIKKLDTPQASTQWISLTGCLAEKTCVNDDFFNFIIAVAIEHPDDVPHSKLVVDLVTVNRYWNSERVVEFSKALASADEQIDELEIQVATNKWEAILKCEGACPEFHSLFYEMIRLVVQV